MSPFILELARVVFWLFLVFILLFISPENAKPMTKEQHREDVRYVINRHPELAELLKGFTEAFGKNKFFYRVSMKQTKDGESERCLEEICATTKDKE